MGFLSKLFGGDAAAGKAADTPSSSVVDPAGAVALDAPVANEVVGAGTRVDAAPSTDAAPATPVAPPSPVRQPVLTDAHRVPPGIETPLRAPASATLEASKAPPVGRALRENGEPKAPASSLREPSGVPRRAGADALRRAGPPESSIITSAPAMTPAASAEPQRAAAPRPGIAAGPARPSPAEASQATGGEEAGPDRARKPSSVGDAGLLGSRTRKDRSKSPGFYSNMAPAYGSQVVNAGSNPSHVKRTVVGVAPPPELGSVDAVDSAIKAAETPRATRATPRSPESNGAPHAAALREPPAPAVDAVDTVDAVDATPPDSAPPLSATDDLEKEETAPGVGHMPSRHDPTLRNEIPDSDLELLLYFVMDLGLGLANEAWLATARAAFVRLEAAASRLQRSALDKALAQLGVELAAPNALGEERRGRIGQQFVLVDLALPRPIDVSGQRLVRERLIVQHLLTELSVLNPLIAQRLRDEGTLTLERFSRLGAADLAEKAGISPQQAECALLVFRDYLSERGRRGPETWLLGKARTLEQRLGELEASARLFETLADGDDVQAKREARRKRQADIARLSLLLAEWGEAGILGEFERCSVQGKIARLRRWLTELPAG